MLTMKPTDEPALEFAKNVGERIEDRIDRSNVPILGLNEDAFEEHGSITVVTSRPVIPMGTGTLFRIGGLEFLVTAAHVFSKCEEDGLIPCIGTGDPAFPTPLKGMLYPNELADVAVHRIDKSVSAGISNERWFGLSDVDLRADVGDGWFFVSGFPVANGHAHFSFSSLNTFQWSWKYRTSLYQGPTNVLEHYNAEAHILLDNSGEPRHVHDSSPAVRPSTLRGISGSSIWLGFSEQHVMDDWSPDMAKIVAVETCVYENAIRGTRWIAVAKVLWDNFVETREELSSVIPTEFEEFFAN